MRRFLILSFLLVLFGSSSVAAQSLDEVADEVDQTGRFVEFDLDADTAASIDRANSNGIAFVWLDQGGTDAQQVADGVASRLEDAGSRYGSLVVLNNDDFWVLSRGDNGAAAASAARGFFASGAVGTGLDAVTDAITGTATSETPSTTVATGTSGSSSSSSGGGFPWFWAIVVAVLGFLGFRYVRGKSTAKKLVAQEIERDRAEIQEQLRNNADRVIDLGDKVIATGDGELIRTYEQASASYQDVSTSIDEAVTAEEVDALDDKIDEAEWQFEVIEARLEGRTPPPRPAPDADDAIAPSAQPPSAGSPAATSSGTPAPPSPTRVPPLGSDRDRPALGRDDSVFDGPARPAAQRQPAPRSRRRGGMGGMGGMLGGVLGSILLGGGGRRRRSSGGLGGALGGVLAGQQSRRSQRRSSGSSGGLGSGGGLGSLSGRTGGRTSGGGSRGSGWSGGGGKR